MLHRLGPGQLVGVTITTIPVDSVDNELSLLFIEELCLVREIDDKKETKRTEGDCDDAEEEEDPTPGVQNACLGHESKPVANDVGETGDGH
jgi:hypothetical protein